MSVRPRRCSWVLGFVFVASGGVGATAAPASPERFTISVAKPDHFAGTYRLLGHVVSFDVVTAEEQRLVFRSSDGAEIVRVEAGPAGARMWRDGQALDLVEAKKLALAGVAPPREVLRWIKWVETDEAEVIASMWRDLNESPVSRLPAAQALFRFSVHMEEGLAAMARERDDVAKAKHRCDDCFGKCGPGCWAVGYTSYCVFHDCCCDHYGGFACFTWCFVYPACPDCDQQVCGPDTPAICGSGYTECPNGSPCGNCGWECPAAQGQQTRIEP
ncbi:MAG TPA: hypothetical protein VGN09_11360 [Vicinamibacteria bacterium]